MNLSSLSSINKAFYTNSTHKQNQQKINLQYENDKVDLSIKKKKPFSIKKMLAVECGILAALGGITACILLTKSGKFNPANFEKHIDFSPAGSIEEAKEFAKKHFHIEKFDLEDDLEVANWVNEGLTNINNAFGGKAHLPKTVSFITKLNAPEKDDSTLACVNMLGELFVNKKMFDTESITQQLGGVIKLFEEKGVPQGIDAVKLISLREEILPMLKEPSKYSRVEWMKKMQDFEALISDIVTPMKGLTALWNNPKAKNSLIESGINLNLREIFEKSSDEQKAILDDCLKQLSKKYGYISIQSKDRFMSEFDTLYHEMGHLQNWGNSSFYDLVFGKLSGKQKNIEAFLKDFDKQQTAGKVSWYAQTQPQEFVAETFAQLCNGKKLDDDVIQMYRKYNGVLV